MNEFRIAKPLKDAGMPAFFYYDPNHQRFWSHLKDFIASDNPVLVRLYPGKNYPMDEEQLFSVFDREGHVVNIIGYDDEKQEVYVADPWNKNWGGIRGGVTKISYDDFIITDVNCTRGAVTMVTPFQIKVSFPTDLIVGNKFLVESQIHYPKPRFVSDSENHLHALHAKIDLPDGLEFVRDKSVKRVGDGYLQPNVVSLA